MAKGPTFNTITAAFASASKLNANNALIVTSFDNTLSRDGSTPNTMGADLDMNSNDILNVNDVNAVDIIIGGVSLITQVDAAATSATASASSATDSAASATTSEASAVLAAQDITRNEIATTTIDSSIDLIRTSGFAAVGDGGDTFYKRVGSDPTHSLKVTSSDGAFWEIVPGASISFITCGGVEGDSAANGTANVTAFNNFMSFAVDDDAAQYGAAPILFFPEGHYHFNNHLNVEAGIHMLGAGGWGRASTAGSILEWAAEFNGIIVQAHNTLDLTTKSTGADGAGAVIESLNIRGGGSGGTVGNGVFMRSRATVKNCFITDWPVNGINIVATAGGGGISEGNANTWRVEGAKCEGNGKDGLHTDGADVNAGHCVSSDFANNGRWGVFDSSFLGNTYTANHTQNNGLALTGANASDESSHVSFGSNRYAANVDASEQELVDTEPGTDETKWFLLGAGGVTSSIPLWVASKPLGTYFNGGPFKSDNLNARNTFVGNYVEGGQSPSQFIFPTIVLGGTIGAVRGAAIVHRDNDILGTLFFHNHETSNFAPDRDLSLVFNPVEDKMLRFTAGGDHAAGIGVCTWDELHGQMQVGEVLNALLAPIAITSGLNTEKYGRDAAISSGNMGCHRGIFIGKNINSSRLLTNDTAAPTAGDRARGEFVINSAASIGGAWAWYCTTGHVSSPTFTTVYGIGTQQSAITDANVAHDINSTFSDTEVEAALDVLGTKINSLIAVLEYFGFAAT